jgi:hypothetical protein
VSGQDIIRKFGDKECIQPWRGGDFVIPVPEVTVAVLLRLGDVEDFILDWVSVRSRLGVNYVRQLLSRLTRYGSGACSLTRLSQHRAPR